MPKLTDAEKQAIGERFSRLAREVKSNLDSMAYAAPEMIPGWRARIWDDIGQCADDVIELVEGGEDAQA